MKTHLAIFLLTLLSATSFAQSAPAPTETVLKEAYSKASNEHKKVIIIFHASWCGWCKKMEASINDPACKKMFDDNYVIAYIDVLEHPGKENLENTGSLDLLKKYKGEKEGLPFWLILDAKGTLLADSEMRPEGAGPDTHGESIGCPASEKEVAYFAKLLKTTSKLNDAELAVISARFRKNELVKTTTGTN
jgi:thiol-disulfide isomerase/thioredoxin